MKNGTAELRTWQGAIREAEQVVLFKEHVMSAMTHIDDIAEVKRISTMFVHAVLKAQLELMAEALSLLAMEEKSEEVVH